jgi:precorrin-6x reductase
MSHAEAEISQDSPLVVIQANSRAARAAHSFGIPTVFVQRPGSPVEEVLDDRALLHQIDFADENFSDFVTRILRPLGPRAVVAADESARTAARLANRALGVDSALAQQFEADLRAAAHEA